MSATVRNFLRVCKQQGVLPTRYLLTVNIANQTTSLWQRSRDIDPAWEEEFLARAAAMARRGHATGYEIRNGEPFKARYTMQFKLVKTYRCSTSKYGIGEKAGSNMTPRGLHRVAKKVGGGWPVGAAWKSRQLIGFTWTDQPMTPIAHRIFWLEGLESGFNKGQGIDTYERFVYIHGTGNEPTLGRPDSHGCVHLSANDLLPLYDKLPEGTLVWIAER
jgi:hypothetical protein